LRIGRAALDADHRDLQTLHNLALVHYRRLERDDSIAPARRALAVDPTAAGAHLQLAGALLLRGDFAEGWEEHEWRYRVAGVHPPMPPTDRPHWDGAPLADATLLLIADQVSATGSSSAGIFPGRASAAPTFSSRPIDGIALVAQQTGPGRADIAGYFGRAPLANLGAELRDFGDTMAVIDALDLVVTVDTAVAHLAAAMGKAVWILLPYSPDWRWLLQRSDSPWYPAARLFRQSRPGDWAGVIRAVCDALCAG
jgi:hypothetical protein